MSNELYIRKVEVIAGNRKLSGDDFDIEFTIPFDDGEDANVAEIDIYNLKDSTINNIRKGTPIIVNAGYIGDVGAVLIGTVAINETEWNSVDKKTTLHTLDSNDAWMETDVKKTYKEGITAKQILNDLLPKTGLKVAAFNLPLNQVYSGAKTIDSKLGKAIVEIAKDCNAKIHVNRGKIFIRPKAEGDKIAYMLDKDHGLIGSPTPVEKEEKYFVVEKEKKEETVKGKKVVKYVDKYVQKSRTKRGFKVVSLLNHRFTTDVVIQIKSKTANGFYRIEKGTHKSNGGSTYYTEMEVYPL